MELKTKKRVSNFNEIQSIYQSSRIFLFGRTYKDSSQINVFISPNNLITIYAFGARIVFHIADKKEAENYFNQQCKTKKDMPFKEINAHD